MIKDELIILRLVWHSSDFDSDGNLKGSAFRSDDLRPDKEKDDTPKFVSTDRVDMIFKPSIDWRIEYQQSDGKREKMERFEARFAEFKCAELRSVERGGRRQFDVTAEPEPAGADGPGSPENQAHCALRHVSGFTGSKGAVRSYVEYLRTQLIKKTRAIHSYGAIFPLVGRAN